MPAPRPGPAVVSNNPDWRRLLPPRRRRPGLLAIAVRWRVELVVVALAGIFWSRAGTVVAEIVGAGVLVAATALPAGRSAVLGIWQLFAVPHRLRSAFVQAGVASRAGHLPWIFWAFSAGSAIKVALGLRSGITVGDLRQAVPVIQSACGAAEVDIVERRNRGTRLVVMVNRPRRGIL